MCAIAFTDMVISWIFDFIDHHREHWVVYCTQKGFLHIYDVRARNPVTNFNFGMKHGGISAMTIGPKDDQALIGTMDGSLITYDFRYNSQLSYCRYTKEAYIANLQTFYPNKYRKFWFNNAYHTYPLAFVATSDGSISLIDMSDLEQSDTKEIQIVMIPSSEGKAKKHIGSFKEKPNLGNSASIALSSVGGLGQSIVSSTNFALPKDKSRIQQILENTSPNTQTALLSPKHWQYKFSASFLLTGDMSGRIRYWNIEKDLHNCKNFYHAEDEKSVYTKKLFKNTFHVMTHETVKKEPVEESKSTGNFSFLNEPLEKEPLLQEGHTAAVNAFGMLYNQDDHG
jgi:WD40 repeat protein